jgi:hypothetical protein
MQEREMEEAQQRIAETFNDHCRNVAAQEKLFHSAGFSVPERDFSRLSRVSFGTGTRIHSRNWRFMLLGPPAPSATLYFVVDSSNTGCSKNVRARGAFVKTIGVIWKGRPENRLCQPFFVIFSRLFQKLPTLGVLGFKLPILRVLTM